MQLSDDQIRSVLARAEEIRGAVPVDGSLTRDMQALIDGAEAVGIPRTAMERALREELNLPERPVRQGELVFAKSMDDKFYVATVESLGENELRVRFLKGGEHTVAHSDVRPCSFLPGEKVVVDWPWWGPWTCTVVSYDAARQKVKVTDGWDSHRTFPIAEVWLAKGQNSVARRGGRRALHIPAIAVALGAGSLIGSLITLLLLSLT